MTTKKLPLWAFYALLCALIFCPGLAQALEGKIIKIADSDTVTLLTSDHEKIKIRLYGIDTPKKAQPYGTEPSSLQPPKWEISKLLSRNTAKTDMAELWEL